MSSAISQGPHNVFVYGSLLSDDVVSALLKRVPCSSPALLNANGSASKNEFIQPFCLLMPSKLMGGNLVEVSLVENTEKIKAFTYVWDDKDDPNLYGDWNFEEWKQLHLSDFLKMTKDFVEEFEQPDAKTMVETYESHYKQDDNKATA